MRHKPFMLATDLDGTFVGQEENLGALLAHFDRLPHDVSLVYITGRHLSSAKSLIYSEKLPIPDLLVTDVGTAIYHHANVEDSQWAERMSENWRPDEIISIAEDFPLLNRQALPDNRRISFTVPKGNSSLVEEFQNALERQGITHTFIFSSDRDIDVLPAAAGKGKALEYIFSNYTAKNVQALIAGDSGNDMDMLSLGYPSVIVGNAQPELIAMEDHPNLYRAVAHCAGGILEAWLHFYGKEAEVVRT